MKSENCLKDPLVTSIALWLQALDYQQTGIHGVQGRPAWFGVFVRSRKIRHRTTTERQQVGEESDDVRHLSPVAISGESADDDVLLTGKAASRIM